MQHRSLYWLFLFLGACENQSPTAPEIAIEPAAPNTTDDLEVVFGKDITDPEGDRVDRKVSWLKEGIVQWEKEGLTTVAASETAKGENWEVVVVASDGLSDPSSARTGVTIQNIAPRLDSVAISPEEPTGDSTLQAEAVFVDEDGDNVSLTYVWNRTPEGGAEETTEFTDSYVPGDATAKNETWTVEVTPSDDEEPGAMVSATAVIANTPPEITEVKLALEVVYTLDDLEASVAVQDADGDTITLTYEWTVNGTRKNDTDETLDFDQFVKGDEVVLTVTPNDGFQDGDTVTSDTVTIQNSLPTLTGVIISSNEPDPSDAFEASTLECIPVGWTDDDGDPDSYGYTWTVNGSALNAPWETINGDHFNKHDIVSCTVWPMNGAEQGIEWTSDDLEIQNTPPDLTDVSLDNTSPSENDIVTPVITVTDADGDNLTHTVTWHYTNGGGILLTASTIDGTWFDRGDEFYAIVSSNDGEDDSPVSRSSDSATVGNTPPNIASVVLDATEYALNDVMTATISGTDLDGDTPLTASYQWIVDGSPVTGITSNAVSPYMLGAVKGDLIFVNATLDDGYGGVSAPGISAHVTVIDTPPSINNLYTDSTANDAHGAPRSTADVTVYFDMVDIDTADTPSADVQWISNNGSVLFRGDFTGASGGAATTLSHTLPASWHTLIRGDTLSVLVTPSADGATGTAESANITLGNGLPEISGLTLTPDPAFTDDTLNLNVTNSTDRDGDSVSLGYVWTVNSNNVGGNTNSLAGTVYFNRGDTVMVVTTPTDSQNESGAPQTMSLVVENSPPQDLAIAIDNRSPMEQEDDIVCQITTGATDPDEDAIDYEFTWRINETVNGSGWRSFSEADGDNTYQTFFPEDSVQGGDLYVGETLECTVTVTDSQGASLAVTDQVTPIPDPCGSGAASLNSATASNIVLDGGTQDGSLDFGDFTIEGWVNPASTPGGLWSMPFIGALDSNTAYWSIGWAKISSSHFFRAYITIDDPGTGSNVAWVLHSSEEYQPQPNSWHHVALTRESSGGSQTYRFFVNGRLVDTEVPTGIASTITSPISIGKVANMSGAWNGKIDEVRISSTALYTADFQPESRFAVESDTMALYHLDDGAGTTAIDSAGTGSFGDGTVTQVGSVAWSTDSVCDVSGDIAKVAMGQDSGCWLTQDGEIDCWGINRYPNQLYGSTNPADIAQGTIEGHPTDSGYLDVDIEYYHACAIDSSNCVTCWGDYDNNLRSGDSNGGGGTNPHPASCDFEAIAVGNDHNCALHTDGTVYCWGWNNWLQVTDAPSNIEFSKISAAWSSTCGLRSDTGMHYCWGDDDDLMDSSQGSPNYALSDIEVNLKGAAGIKESDGQVVAWGDDMVGWNRTGAYPSSTTAPFPTIYGARSVGMSRFTGCAANATGQVDCWGHKGDYTGDPTKVTPGVYQDVIGAYDTFCGLTVYGRVNCWGPDDWGETYPPSH